MGKNNKTRRVDKKRIRAKKLKKTKTKSMRKEEAKSPASIAPVFTVMDNPIAGLTEEQRRKIVSSIGRTNKTTLQESLNTLQTILKSYNPIMLLATVSGYGLSIGAGDKGVQNKDGHGELSQSHVELLQALCLQMPEGDWGHQLATPDVVQRTWDSLIEICRAFSLSRMNSDILDASENLRAIMEVQEWVRLNTQSVRNWGYYSQVQTISLELYSYFDSALREKHGFSATDAIKLFHTMLRSIENSLTQRFQNLKRLKAIKKPQELLIQYHELIGQSKEDANRFAEKHDVSAISTNRLFAFLLSHYDLQITESYCFTAELLSDTSGIDLETTQHTLRAFSYLPGSLADSEAGLFFLDNPIWEKPIIDLDRLYFCPIPQLFFSFILSNLDGLVENIDKTSLYDRRARYLEQKIKDIVVRRFPEALTVTGVKWRHNNKQLENDLITFIDSYAIIIEAKSHKISKSALRGAPDRIKREIREIFVAPSIQSKRLEDRLNELRLNPAISDELRNTLPVSLEKIHKVLRVSVSLENFASLQSNLSRFVDTGWLPDDFSPCPTMNLADFETLFDFLEHPVQIVHYLHRRMEMEGCIQFVGDELDLMGLYTTTLFNLDGVPQQDNQEIIISGMSAPLDKYYNSKDEGIVIDKPKPKTSNLFNDIFQRLEERAKPQWTEIGAILSRFSPNDQEKISSYVADAKRIVNRTWKTEDHKNTVVYVPPETSGYALAYVLFKNANASKMYEFVERAAELGLEPNHVQACVVIAKNIDRDDQPYRLIGLYRSSTEQR